MDKSTISIGPWLPVCKLSQKLPGRVPYFHPFSIDQWIGLLGKILTGNHQFSHEDHGAFRFQFSRENPSISIEVPSGKLLHN